MRQMINFRYNSVLLKVVDGDTVDLQVDLGFNTWVKERFRLFGINAPESRTRDLDEKKLGLASKQRLSEILNSSDIIVVETLKVKKGKYGRYLATLYVPVDGVFVNVNHKLVEEGHAVFVDY